MIEKEWAQYVAQKLDAELPNYHVAVGKKLIVANEIVQYNEEQPLISEVEYDADILIYESHGNDSFIPRVIIDTRISNVSTDEAIACRQKIQVYKNVHQYLRYGIFIGNRKTHPLPGRLLRHGEHFDFMLYWQDFKPLGYEWETLVKIVRSEIYASKQLEEMLLNNRHRDKAKYFAIHKQLIATPVK